ncbi:MAG: outer membrane beta-barrel protein [Gammaproteobacteria bacterium]|nr:outer membrane beta-barrel protein [Gammaproteobacteria bacterium]
MLQNNYRKMTTIFCGLTLLAFGFADSAWALKKAEPQGMPVGSGVLYPSARYDLSYDDNIYDQELDNYIKSSAISILEGGLKMEWTDAVHQVGVDFDLEAGFYHSYSDDDYVDGQALLEGAYLPNDRLYMYGSVGYIRGHDARGAGALQGGSAIIGGVLGNLDSPDLYSLAEFHGLLKYGVDEMGAPRFELDYLLSNKAYENHRSRTRYQDRTLNQLTATLFYKVQPNTAVLIEGEGRDYDYDENDGLDSKELQMLAGATWDITAVTSGHVKAGWASKNFSSSSPYEDDSQPAWEVGVLWRPLSYSTFGLVTSRGFDESNGSASFIDARRNSINWTHDWRSYLQSVVTFSKDREIYISSSLEDDLWGVSLSLEYVMRPGLTFGGRFSHEDRDSNLPTYSYDKNIFGVDVNWEM